MALVDGCCVGAAEGRADGSVVAPGPSCGTTVAAGVPDEFIVSVLPIKMPIASTMTNMTTMAAIFHRVLLSMPSAKIHIPDR